ncbi:hypothetical protein B0H34DRAFT_683088 [Crassisporium funariophilum]|nr:hypothetical protein B0H34DRAFT_683088 [Crassisporium funariophilum]
MFRTALPSVRTKAVFAIQPRSSSRPFHASPAACKTVTEKVSEVADKVNKKVGKGLASAIDQGEKATNAAKDTMGEAANNTKKKASETGHVASQKGREAAAEAREAKDDFQKEMKK